MANRRDRRSCVYLYAYDAVDSPVLEQVLSFEDYYEELHPIIDVDEFRAVRGIRRLSGRIYDLDGKQAQEFENFYDENGSLLRGRAVHEDGTVNDF